MPAGQLTEHLAKIRAHVVSIRERGGHVVFLRMPSSGPVLEAEERIFSKGTYWAALLEATEATGIHYDDSEQLRSFDCPDFTHLDAHDAVEFSRSLAIELLHRVPRVDSIVSNPNLE